MQVVTERVEEPVRDRHHPVMPALALDNEHPPIRDLDVGQSQSEDLAATQPAEQHRRHHRPVAVRAQRRDQLVGLGRRQDRRQRAGHSHQRGQPRPARATLPPRRQTTRHRIACHARVTARDRIGIEARHRRQPPGDRARRQTRLPVTEPDHAAIAALLREELEHIRRRNLPRAHPDDSEERLQIERHRPQRVQPSPTSHELQIPVDELITEPIPHLARHSCRAHQERETSHERTLAARPTPARYDTKITRVLGDLAHAPVAACPERRATHYECPGHRPTSAHPVHLGTCAPPSRHSVHTERSRCR